MFKLIRDNIPELVKAEGKTLDYAVAENPEFFTKLLKAKLVEEVNEYLTSGSMEELVDIASVITTLVTNDGHSREEFNQAISAKAMKNGMYDKKYIGFFADEPAKPVEK